jgi:quercetin dioxygenase-like cupin family protein
MRDVSALGNLSHSQLDDIPWARMERPYGTVEMRLIRCSPVRNTYTNMVRWPAGMVLPTHLHLSGVHSFTFSGRWHYREHDWWATAGSYVYEPTGTVHTLEVVEDVEALFMVDGTIVWYDSDGRPAVFSEAADLLDDVTKALVAQGLTLPDIVVQD